MRNTQWARLLAYVTGMVNQRLLMQNEYLAAENRVLRSHLPARVRLSDPERSTLAAIGKRSESVRYAEPWTSIWSIIIESEITRARTTFYYFRRQKRSIPVGAAAVRCERLGGLLKHYTNAA